MNTISQAIINTLCYSDIFTYPLTSADIHRYLIHSRKTPPLSIQTSLSRLVKQDKVIQIGNFYCLPGRKRTILLRNQRYHTSQEKTAIARKMGDRLKIIPTIQAIYLTGALAMDNAIPNDDIDFMIVTTPNQLWTTRALVNLSLDLLHLRRKPATSNSQQSPQSQPNHNNKLCLNLWLDTTSLKVPNAHQNLYTAHEVAQAKLLWDRDNTHALFIHQNKWMTRFLANTPLPPATAKKDQYQGKHNPGIIESKAYHLQCRYMKGKQTRETISPHLAFFHPRDTGQWVMTEYTRRLQKLSQ